MLASSFGIRSANQLTWDGFYQSMSGFLVTCVEGRESPHGDLEAASAGQDSVRRLNVEGDGQGDLAGHGGEHRAVMVYQMDAYRYWEAQLGRKDFSFGQFGENFTVDGLADDEVCIGDRYRIGSALFEVTQPRVTCYRVGIRMEEPAMAALLVSHHRPGFYFRVLEEGEVGAGDEIVKVADGPERITVADIDALLYLPNPSREQLERSLRVPALSQGWKTSLKAIAEQKTSEGGNPGLKASSGPPPAWPGFRPLRVAEVDREAANVVSLSFEQTDGAPLPAALPGQFLVLRLRTTPNGPMLLRNYSMSGMPGAATYRVSVKRETKGVVSSYLNDHVQCGRYFGGERASGRFYSEIRRCSRRLAQCRHRGNARTRHVALAVLRGVTSSGLVDLRSA